jgi:hypothetical protein
MTLYDYKISRISGNLDSCYRMHKWVLSVGGGYFWSGDYTP